MNHSPSFSLSPSLITFLFGVFSFKYIIILTFLEFIAFFSNPRIDLNNRNRNNFPTKTLTQAKIDQIVIATLFFFLTKRFYIGNIYGSEIYIAPIDSFFFYFQVCWLLLGLRTLKASSMGGKAQQHLTLKLESDYDNPSQ